MNSTSLQLPAWMKGTITEKILKKAHSLSEKDLTPPEGFPIKEGDRPLGEAGDFVRRLYTICENERDFLVEAEPDLQKKAPLSVRQDIYEAHAIIKECTDLMRIELKRAFGSTDLRDNWVVVETLASQEPLGT